MRGVMIIAGVAAVQKFRWMTLLFAGILLLSAISCCWRATMTTKMRSMMIGDADRAASRGRYRRV